MRQRPLYFVALAFALVLASATAGCSSSDDNKTDAASGKSTTSTTISPLLTTTTSTTVVPPSGATGGDLKAFCAAFDEIVKLGSGNVTTGTPAQQQAAIREHYTKIGAIGNRLVAAAPDEIKQAVQVAMRINGEVVSSGSLKPFDSAENKRNGPLVAAYAAQQCKGA